jgi:hypothetical protein
MISRLVLPTTPGLDYEPWRLAAKGVEKLDIEEYFLWVDVSRFWFCSQNHS